MSMALIHHLRHLRAACVVAALGSTVKAAAALHLSQSSVARAVQDLEQALGMALFDRGGRGMFPTEVGRALLDRVDRALSFLMGVRLIAAREVKPLAWVEQRWATRGTHRHLSVLISLAATRSESASAGDLGISQPAVHQALAQLEHMVGAQLFMRARRGLRLTEAGENALHAAKLCRAELEQADEELELRMGSARGRLVIGTLPFSTGRLLACAIDRVLDRYPALDVTVVDGTYDVLIQDLREADIDFVVGALRPTLPAPDVVQETLFVDALAVMVRAGHPLAQRNTLTWSDLRQAEWIMPMPHTPADQAFDQCLRQAGLPRPSNSLRVNSAMMMVAVLVNSDRLAMLAPRQFEREIDAGLMVQLPLPVHHAPREIGLVRRANYWPTPAGRELMEALRRIGMEMVPTSAI